jgi:hypothetical protein
MASMNRKSQFDVCGAPIRIPVPPGATGSERCVHRLRAHIARAMA